MTMFIHIVCWKYKPEIAQDVIDEHRRELAALLGKVPGVVSLKVGGDVLHLDRSFDTGLTSEFASREDFDVYAAHPEHQKVIALGREIAERVVSVDFIT